MPGVPPKRPLTTLPLFALAVMAQASLTQGMYLPAELYPTPYPTPIPTPGNTYMPGSEIDQPGMHKRSPFACLGFEDLTPAEAKVLTHKEILANFRTATLRSHPDKFLVPEEKAEASETFHRLILSRDALVDTSQRDDLIRKWIDHL